MDITAGVMGSVVSKLGKLLKEEYNLPSGAKEDLKYVAEQQKRLQAYFCSMTDAPPDQLGKFDRGWLSKISEAFCKTDNIVDSLLMFNECSKEAAHPGLSRRLLGRTRDSPTPHPDPTDLIARIKEITLDVLDVFATHTHPDSSLRALHRHEEEKEPIVVCIDEPTDVLIKMLTEGDDDISMKQKKTVSIVGLGGLGKTTLAQVVYHRLKPQFDCAAFVRVPVKPADMVRFFKEMLHQLIDVENHMNVNVEAMDDRQLVALIREFLLNRRYLIVIDDLWNEDDWHSISSSLPNNGYGSRVITTTRVNDIAKLCCSGCDELIYEVHYLGYEKSRKLFIEHYNRHGVSWDTEPGDFFLFVILKMCSGTPSAIISIASLLATKVTPTKPSKEMMYSVYFSWKQKPHSLGSESENIAGDELFREIISRIYAHLPSTLKDCLLYLAVHAKNQIIHRTTMVRKWIAEGFISEKVRQSQEEVASGYFDELINRNFIRLSEYDNYSREEMYEVNKMVLHALRQISKKEKFATVLSDVGISREYDHYFRLSVQCSSGSELSIDTAAVNPDGNIRSMTISGPAKFYLKNDLVYLRVLDLDGCKDLENSAMELICRMTLLKYLSLRHTPVRKIPPEIGGLHYLETLDLRQTEISNLPPEIGKLQQLKTLDARQTKLGCLPREIGKLQNLETLDVRQTQVKELPKEIVHLPKLAYLYFGHSSSGQGVKLPVGSDQLNSVKALGTVDSREWSGSAMEEISGLTGVRELEVVLYDKPSDKDRNDKLLSSVGKCANLEYLIIYGDYIPSDELPLSTNFLSLERLKVGGRFAKVPRWLAEFTTLRKLDIRVCKLDQDDLKYLELYAYPAQKFPSGIINLHRLEKITLRYSSHHASSGGIKKAVGAMREQVARHGNLIKLSDNGDSEVVRTGQGVNTHHLD
uniref:NBS-LRR disease resistance protein n=1 Tax=Dasypyrum villosum TaxID=40247 RepID=A0A8K1MK61_9POAL|nr:NBS-LRR disease resistance protein [Dasypyrum villosum]